MAIYAPPRPTEHSPHVRPRPGTQRLELLALVALGLSTIALAAASLSFVQDPARPSVVAVVASEPTYSASEVSLARDRACRAWDTAAAAMATASNAAADAPTDWDNPLTKAADANDARTTFVETAYLRNEITAATPKELADSLGRYQDLTIAIQHASVQRMASTLNSLSEKLNTESRTIQNTCGLG